MSVLKFLSDNSIMDVNVRLEGNRIELTFQEPIATITSLIALGFQELNEFNYNIMSDFSNHKYLYHEELEHYIFTITDDPADIWTPQPDPPEPAPEPEPYIPTLEEVKIQKITEMESTMSQVITNGVTVTLSDGTTALFGLSTSNQISLSNLRLMAEQAVDKDTPSIPWHSSDESSPCQYFSPTDIMLITDNAIAFTTFNITFFRDLRIYINSLETKEDVEPIVYDISSLPEEYWSEPLADIIHGSVSA